jgi:hypothetical protein
MLILNGILCIANDNDLQYKENCRVLLKEKEAEDLFFSLFTYLACMRISCVRVWSTINGTI